MPKTPQFATARNPVALAVLALTLIHSAGAQTAAEDKDKAQAEAKKAETPQKLDTVVVSGSRIKRDTYSTPAPVQIIKNEESTLAGFTSTAQVLQGTAVTGGQAQVNNAFGGFVTDGGPGANTVGLRGFGPTRSLILLNGRRMSPSGTRGSVGATDLNTLPNSIVDRIEVLKDGASSIYGSDAVAGVINVITKKNVSGITVDAGTSRTQDGGGNTNNIAISGGLTTDSARFLAAYQFNENTALTLGERDWTQCNTDYRRTSVGGVVGDWGSADFKDPLTGKPKCYPITGTGSNGVTINTIGTNTQAGVGAAGSVGTSFNRWRPNSGVTTGLVGFEGVGGGANNINVRDTFDPRTLNRTMMSPVSNHNLYLQGGIDIPSLGDAELYAELMVNRRRSSQVGYRQLALDYNKGSALIPANLAGSTFSGPTNTSSGNNIGVRAFIGFGNDYSHQSVEFNRGVIGLRGSLGSTGWDYDVTVVHADSRGSYTFQSMLVDRLAQSLNVVKVGNTFNCVNPAGGCVAAPALTSQVIGGQLPKAWVDYVWQDITGNTRYKEDVITASTTGTLFSLPYGKVKGAFGVEGRRASINDMPAADSINSNLYGFTSSLPTIGSDEAKDVFGELEIPLLKNLPFARELTLNASSRYAHYKSYGGDSTYKIGALYSPTTWLSIRGTQGTSYRAPALSEQFLGSTTGFINQQNDPCNAWDNPANNGTTRQANCRSEGLPAGFNATSSITVISTGGRETGLKAETSKNGSWGIILQPQLPTGAGDLSLALDRFDIRVDNGVSSISGATILQLCYDDPAFRTGGGWCRLVDPRNSTSQALTVTSGNVNLATDIVRGYDINARYSNDVGIGRLRMNLGLTHFTEKSSKVFEADPLTDVNGRLRNPKWAGTFDMSYTVKAWNFFYGLEWSGSTDSYASQGENPDTSQFLLKTPSYFLHSASVTYSDTPGKWKATFGVRNIADKEPPVVSSGVINRIGNAPLYSGYDYLGRRFFLNVSKSF